MLIDRHILLRFATNFVLLFLLLFVFAATVDLVVGLDRFADAVEREGEALSSFGRVLLFVKFVADFQAPRIFQFFAFMHGLVAVAATAFTLAQMNRRRELLALLAAGVSLQRIALPFFVGMFIVSVLQVLNQEYFVPQFASRMLRAHGEIGRDSTDAFPVALTVDQDGALIQAANFDPRGGVLSGITIIEPARDDGRRRRIDAESGRWSGDRWALTDGLVRVVSGDPSDAAQPAEPIGEFATDVGPDVLVMRRHGQFATMLSLRQIREMLDTPGVRDRAVLIRQRYARFVMVLVNLLVLGVALPTFLDRVPGNLATRTLACAGIAIPTLLGAGIFVVVDLPVPPTVGVFLPALVLLPVFFARWTQLRT